MTFGEKLQSLRKQKGLSLEQLASQLAISMQAVSKWELDSSSPDTENIIQLSKLFHVSIDYLLKDELEHPDEGAVRNDDKTGRGNSFFGGYKNILGISFSLIGLIGNLTLGVLSSIHPVEISSAVVGNENSTTVRTGLPAFLEYHHIEWIGILCSMAIITGISILLSLQIKKIWCFNDLKGKII